MSRPRLLIVEDQPETRAAMRRIADGCGYEVFTAATLAEANEALDPPPDGIVLDLVLPDGNGEDILRTVRDGHLETRVVAVVTGLVDVVRLQQVVRLRPDLLLIKPIDPDVLLRLFDSEFRHSERRGRRRADLDDGHERMP